MMTCVEQAAREKILRAFGGERVMTIGRAAVITQPHNGRLACHYCGSCQRGCITHSYFNSIGSTLPAARRTGRLTLRPHSVVAEVLHDPIRGRARGVRVIDALTSQELEYTGRIIFLCASAIESVRLLLNSRSTRFPNGLANSSGTLGHYVMDHHYGSGASGTMPGFADKRTVGHRPNGIYIARFRNVKHRHPDFLRGYGMQGGSSRAGWGRGTESQGYGDAFKQALIENLGPWVLQASGWGETLPDANNRITLDPQKKRQVGDSRGQNRSAVARERASDERGHGDCGGRDARCRRLHRHSDGAPGQSARSLHPRDGRRSHEPHAGGGGRERLESSVGREEPVRHRRRMHGELGVSESEHHIHGADRARRGERRLGAESW